MFSHGSAVMMRRLCKHPGKKQTIFLQFSAKEARQSVLDKSQSVIILGESGAGKTETSKHIIKSLCVELEGELMDKINNAGPIMEAFGNSKTQKNNNSSRYAKFVEVFVSFYLFFICVHFRIYIISIFVMFSIRYIITPRVRLSVDM